MRLKLGGVDVAIPGWHIRDTIKMWRLGRRIQKDPDFEKAVLDAFVKKGYKVTRDGQPWEVQDAERVSP